MKRKVIALAPFFVLQLASAQNVDLPVLVPRTVDSVYTPLGFDDNDNVEIILHGQYESSCYTNGPVSAKVDVEQKTIVIEAESYFHIGAPCRQMSVPYIQPIKLGFLKAGTYAVRVVANPNAQLAPLVIKAAESESQDEYMYAAVSAAFITSDSAGRQSLHLTGYFPKVSIGCLVMKNVKIDYAPGKVLVVQPIMELRDGWVCNTTSAQPLFTYMRELPVTLEKNQLIHVRSANGESFNALFQ